MSLCSVLIKTERFDVLKDIVKSHSCVIRKSYLRDDADEISFMRFQTYNYTLNKYKNNYNNPRRVSVVADTVKSNANKLGFDDVVKVDILLFYLSLVYPSKNALEYYWYPDCSVYNHSAAVLPRIVSKRYFEKAKVLFGVNTVDEYKDLVASLKFPDNMHDGYHMIPQIKSGLSFDDVASIV